MSEEVISRKTYAWVTVALLILLGATAGAVWIHMGRFNTVVAIGIAVIKALLVVTFFMELKVSPKLLWVVAIAGVFWLTIMFGLFYADYLTRIPIILGG
ncbi:MAG: cytochrome C oxidase subunit IV family protein [Thermoanaerobaculia bacterium]